MKNWALWIAIIAVVGLCACNITVGECWYKSDGENGASSGTNPVDGPLLPSGGGGYGDTPPAQPQGVGPQPPICNEMGSYSASLFKFATQVADDGKGRGGGWQIASATVKFVDGRQDPPAAWTCNLGVGVVIRSEYYKTISPEYAAEATAEVLTDASSLTMHTKDAWIAALFCSKLKDKMNAVFGEQYPSLGARVTLQ
ncbi:MAG: hypothetical protein ABI193_18925 [Minicystis sp.]